MVVGTSHFMSYSDLFKGKKIVAVDTETTGLNYHGSYQDYGFYPARPFVFSFTTYENRNWYARFEVDPFTRRVMFERDMILFYKLVRFFKDVSITKVFHNRSYDQSIIERFGIEVRGKILDTLILSQVDNVQNPSGLKPLCKLLFNITEDDQTDLLKSVNSERLKAAKRGVCIATKEKGFGNSPNKADYWLGDKTLCKKYALTDTDRTMGLWWCLEERYNTDSEYYDLCTIEHKVDSILMYMQNKGIRIDLIKINELLKYYNNIIVKQKYLKRKLGYKNLNPGSSKQMQEVFYKKLKLDPEYKRRKNKGKESTETLTTDTQTLYKWSKTVPLAKCLIEISAAEHQIAFLNGFKETYIHTNEGKILRPNYRGLGAVTGRISCSKPNLLNVSSDTSVKKVSSVDYRTRECFIPRKNYIFYFLDYSQIEVWIAAFLSKDETIMSFLLEGGDLHAKTGMACFGHKEDYKEKATAYRKKGKTLNFGSLYGMGTKAIQDSLDCTYEEADEARFKFWATYKGLAEYNEQLKYEVKRYGYIKNPFGRKYNIPNDQAYKALNYMIQGSAAEVMKRALIAMYQYIKNIDINLLLIIYDELCLEISKPLHKKSLIKSLIQTMQGNYHTYFDMPKPFGVSVAIANTNWAEKKDIEI